MLHVVYFEIYGKKLKAEVIATDAETAKKIIKDKIIFHKIEAKKLSNEKLFKDFKDLFPFNTT